MTPRDREKIVRAHIKWWVPRMRLQEWRIKVAFGHDAETQAEASCSAIPRYHDAQLRFDLAKVPTGEEETYVVHELAHLLSWKAWDASVRAAGDNKFAVEQLEEEFEGLTTVLEKLFLTAYGEA